MATFSKILCKTDTSKTLSVPTKSLKSLPSFKAGHAVEFQAIDESGFVWTFKCSTCKKGQYRKPVLSKGWLAFIRNKNLKVGDKIKFSLNQTAATPFYRVQAEKEVKIFGAIFGYSTIMATFP
ncbi:B3 domain-containing transcription factor NGA4-like [Populus alba x Populus x berolinensis]|nr:B3 domain-containing transcription factor NGA4-like [Populus alba x Populus x berolinensis]